MNPIPGSQRKSAQTELTVWRGPFFLFRQTGGHHPGGVAEGLY
jgi:hypothetical protein